MGGTRLTSLKNENRLSKCRFTFARLPYMTLLRFFIRLLSEKIEHFRAGRYISITQLFILLNLFSGENREYEKT